MKRFLVHTVFMGIFGLSVAAEALPVYSVNGFNCNRLGVTVTCKGPIPGGKDSMTATGHNLIYLTMDVYQNGLPTRYTYFSDTGCLVGYTFGMEGKPVSAVAVHRNGQKASFDIQNENYDQMIAYCERELPGSPKPIAGVGPSAPASSPPAAKSTVPKKTAK